MEHKVNLGEIPNEKSSKDAIHIAVIPLIAGERLYPSQQIKVVDDLAYNAGQGIGIVDPFLQRQFVEKGEKFWLLLHPNTITSLRHEWEHPLFGKDSEIKKSKEWIEDFAVDISLNGYDQLMQIANDWLNYGDYHIYHGIDTPDLAYQKRDEFWKHYEIVTGTKVHYDKKDMPFCCSC